MRAIGMNSNLWGVANATGIRFTSTPFKPDRLFPALKEKFGSKAR